DHARAHRLPELDRGEADATGRTEDEERFPGTELRAILQRVMRGAVREEKRGRGHEVHRIGNREHARGIDEKLLREPAPPGRADHAIADLESGDALADRLHDAGNLAAGRE